MAPESRLNPLRSIQVLAYDVIGKRGVQCLRCFDYGQVAVQIGTNMWTVVQLPASIPHYMLGVHHVKFHKELKTWETLHRMNDLDQLKPKSHDVVLSRDEDSSTTTVCHYYITASNPKNPL